MANFRVDLRDDTPIGARMQQILEDYNVPGTEVYADNAFVSVAMLRWCKERQINLCGTTRRDYGFPDELTFDDMEVFCLFLFFIIATHIITNCLFLFLQVGDSDWLMSSDGLLASA